MGMCGGKILESWRVCSYFKLGEHNGKSPKLQIPKLQKHMDLRPYAPAAEAHENFSYAFVKKMILSK